MTTRYTDQEWASIIAATEAAVLPAVSEIAKAVPPVDSPAFAQTIDHTLLKLDATKAQIDSLCSEARVAGFATVCVRPNYTQQAVSDVKGSVSRVAVVIGFHTGENDLAEKMVETRHAVSHGAQELDLVLNRTHLLAGQYGKIYTELAAIRSLAPHPVLLKLILETSQLTDSQIIAGAVLARAAHFDFIKTSTGFLGHGATVPHVRLMSACCDVLGESTTGGWAGNGVLDEYKAVVNSAGLAVEEPVTPASENGGSQLGHQQTRTVVQKMQVKASGGIRTLTDAITMLQAGATRLGTSGGVWIMKEARESLENGGVPANRNGPASSSDYVRRTSHGHGRSPHGHHRNAQGHSRANSTNSNVAGRRPSDPPSPRSRGDRHAYPSLPSSSPQTRSSVQQGSPTIQGSSTRVQHIRGRSDTSAMRSSHSQSNSKKDNSRVSSTPLPFSPISNPSDHAPATHQSRNSPSSQSSNIHSNSRQRAFSAAAAPSSLRTIESKVSLHDYSKPTQSAMHGHFPARTSSLAHKPEPRHKKSSSVSSTNLIERKASQLSSISHTAVVNSTHHRPPSAYTYEPLETLERKLSIPPAFPGGQTLEQVVIADNSQGIWEGNGVVMMPRSSVSSVVTNGTRGRRAGSNATSNSRVSGRQDSNATLGGMINGGNSDVNGTAILPVRPSLGTRLYTDF